ncbi:MAG: M28 family peptidase [bacterium]
MNKRMLVYIFILILLVLFCLWAYHAMINIRPGVTGSDFDPNDLTAIADLESPLKEHIKALAEKIGPRNVFIPGSLNAAADYIRGYWERTGYEVKTQVYKVHKTDCKNLYVEIPGNLRPDKIVLIGAHYDTVSRSPGANDNGSGVAALLEISRLFHGKTKNRTLRFVAFVNEEPPFFKTSTMGSLVYAKECLNRKENIIAMICLETIGYYRDTEKSQKYPFPLSFFYPDKGNFVAVVGNIGSKPLVRSFTRTFMEQSDFPVECGALLGFIPGIDWSDHWSFWKSGYSAIMITDTALFRYPYYHTPQDTADKIDFNSLARITYGTYRTLSRMAEEY